MWDFIILIILMFGAACFLVNAVEIYEYICDKVLNEKSIKQHRFDFLRGDSGVKLPVDAYYPNLNLVIEYREKQLADEAPNFEARIANTPVPQPISRTVFSLKSRVTLI